MTHLKQDDLDRFDEEGYLVFEGLFDDDLNQRLKDDVDLMMEDRERGEKKMIMSYDELGLLTSEPVVVDRVADLMDGKKVHPSPHPRTLAGRGRAWRHLAPRLRTDTTDEPLTHDGSRFYLSDRPEWRSRGLARDAWYLIRKS